jgi:glycosyltransferase involved in cell wall biosynthesis
VSRGAVTLVGGDCPERLAAQAQATHVLRERGWAVRGLLASERRRVAAGLALRSTAVAHFDSARAALPWLRLTQTLGRRSVVSLDDEEVASLDPVTAGPALARADVLLFAAAATRDRALARGLASGDRSTVLAPVTDPACLAPAQRAERNGGPVHVLSRGRLWWGAGCEHALQAIRRLVDSGVPCQLRISGAGVHEGALRYAIYELDLDGHVELVAPACGAELAAHLDWADLFLSSTVVEGIATGLAEAQAMGVPVVATDATRLAGEPLAPGSAAVVARRDSDALAHAIAQLAGDPDRRRHMRVAGRRAALARLADGGGVTGLEQVYERARWPDQPGPPAPARSLAA